MVNPNNKEILQVRTPEEFDKLGFKQKLDALHNAIQEAKNATEQKKAREKAKAAYKTFYEIFAPEKQTGGKMVVLVE